MVFNSTHSIFCQALSVLTVFRENHNYFRKDEHSLIAVYCQKLMDGQLSHLIPDSPMQVALEIDAEQRKELELMIK